VHMPCHAQNGAHTPARCLEPPSPPELYAKRTVILTLLCHVMPSRFYQRIHDVKCTLARSSLSSTSGCGAVKGRAAVHAERAHALVCTPSAQVGCLVSDVGRVRLKVGALLTKMSRWTLHGGLRAPLPVASAALMQTSQLRFISLTWPTSGSSGCQRRAYASP